MQRIILTICLLAISLSTTQAQNWWKNRIKGEGEITEQEISVESFDGFSLAISGDVYLRQGDQQEVVVKAQQNLIDNMKFKVENGQLRITYDRPVWKSKGIRIYMTTPNLDRISVSGSGNVTSDGTFRNLGDLALSVSGSGNLKFECEAQAVKGKISGSGNVMIKGSGSELDCQISGSGNVNAGDFAVKSATVKISGSGNATVNASEDLEAQVSGSGDIRYKGKPSLKSKTSGSGNVRSIS
jgi:hypothetical protein